MTSLDLRVGALSLLGNPGTSRTLRLIFTAAGEPVTPGPVSVWIGGDERHPNDFTDATEHPATVAGNEATVTVPIPAGRELLRVTIDGALATIGTVTPSLYGTVDQDQTVQVNLDTLEVRLDLAAVPIDLEQRLAGKQDADQALTDLSGATVEAWGKSWLAISEAAAARAALGLGAAATMSPAEIAADPALSATIGLGAGWPRRSGSTQYLTDPYATPGGAPLVLTLGRTYGDWIPVPFNATITGYAFEVTTAADPGSLIRSALHQQTSVEATADLPLLHDGGTSDLSTTGVKQVTGLSIPVTAGTIIRPTLKWEAGTGSPAIRSNRSPRPTQTGISTLIGSTGTGGFCVDTTTSPGPFGTVQLAGSSSLAPRFALVVVPS